MKGKKLNFSDSVVRWSCSLFPGFFSLSWLFSVLACRLVSGWFRWSVAIGESDGSPQGTRRCWRGLRVLSTGWYPLFTKSEIRLSGNGIHRKAFTYHALLTHGWSSSVFDPLFFEDFSLIYAWCFPVERFKSHRQVARGQCNLTSIDEVLIFLTFLISNWFLLQC